MPKKIDPFLRIKAVRLVREQRSEYPSMTAASASAARQLGVGRESVRRWVLQADIDDGTRKGVSAAEHAENKRLKSEITHLRKEVLILRAAMGYFRETTHPTQPMMMGFIDRMRAEGHAVESICRVLSELGYPIAARTYRAWKSGVVASRTLTDAHVLDAVRAVAWTTVVIGGLEQRMLTSEGLYGRRKMTALIQRDYIPEASHGSVDRAMKALGLDGIRSTISAQTRQSSRGSSRPRTPRSSY
ncbi:hypothetical protein SAMN06295879_2204 [Agreia bicolorata]|uniref:Transposase n=1 Tax=Agreia bicolorata TaxID=110935 RepID=A0A1T4Y3D2_9MICO|nr:hypothetical protein SAMN06295879_2204 [Agreia bicolorata]